MLTSIFKLFNLYKNPHSEISKVMKLKYLFTSLLMFLLLINGISQISSDSDLEIRKLYILNNYLSASDQTQIKLRIKILSEEYNGCNTNNYIEIDFSGNLKEEPEFVTFDLSFINCSNFLCTKTFSFPINASEFKKYLNSYPEESGNIKKILGRDQDPGYLFNNDYIFISDDEIEISNVKITDIYMGGVVKEINLLQKPNYIFVENESGEENNSKNRAGLGSKIYLRLNGGRLPEGGSWVWYDDMYQSNIITQGSQDSIEYTILDTVPEFYISVEGIDQKEMNTTGLLESKIYVEVKTLFLDQITTLTLQGNYDKALSIIEQLENSYSDDQIIETKRQEVINKREKEIELKQLSDLLSLDYSLLYNFKTENEVVRLKIQELVNLKTYDVGLNSGRYKFSINLKYVKNDNYHFKLDNSISNSNLQLGNDLVYELNNYRAKLSPPTITFKGEKYEVNTEDNYPVDLFISRKTNELTGKNYVWETDDKFISDIMNSRYNRRLSSYPEGVFKVDITSVDIGEKVYYQTSGYCLKRTDGVKNVFKSLLLPGAGRKSVGYRNGPLIGIGFFALAGTAIGSKIYSNKMYQQYLDSDSQDVLEKSYNAANFANRLSIISGTLGISLYLYDVLAVFGKGLFNQLDPNKLKTLQTIKDTIYL